MKIVHLKRKNLMEKLQLETFRTFPQMRNVFPELLLPGSPHPISESRRINQGAAGLGFWCAAALVLKTALERDG